MAIALVDVSHKFTVRFSFGIPCLSETRRAEEVHCKASGRVDAVHMVHVAPRQVNVFVVSLSYKVTSEDRISALGIMKIHEDKDVKIEWVTPTSMNFIQPRSGEKVLITFQEINEFAKVFSDRAQAILSQLGVPHLTEEQIQRVKDPLGTKGAHVSLLSYNDQLATELGT
jgi:hypothetical protein